MNGTVWKQKDGAVICLSRKMERKKCDNQYNMTTPKKSITCYTGKKKKYSTLVLALN